MRRLVLTLIICLSAGFFSASQAQSRLPELPDFKSISEMFAWVSAYHDQHPQSSIGMLFIKGRKQLEALPWDKETSYEAGLLNHYAQNRETAVRALEMFIAAYPEKVDPEVVSDLVEDYYFTNQLIKAEAFQSFYHQRFPDDRATQMFGYGRRVDQVDNYLFILYCKHGMYEKALKLMHVMIDRRDREKPEQQNFSSTLYNLGSNAYMALGRYDDGIRFLKEERAKYAPDNIMGQYADYYRVVLEYEQIAATGAYEKAEQHLAAQRSLFPNQYALKQYETALTHAKLRGKPMTPLVVSAAIKEIPGVDLSDLKGKVVVLDFWATWCHACIEGFPHMNELSAKYGGKGLVIVGITKPQGMVSGMPEMANVKVDYEKELELTRKLVSEYPRYHMDYPVIMDQPGASLKAYGVGFLPTVVVIDRKGTIRWIGFPVDTQFDMLIDRLISE